MINTAPKTLFGHNSKVKAWCLTALNYDSTATTHPMGSYAIVNGYNLVLDSTVSDVTAPNTDRTYSGTIRFSFVTPLQDTKYKVFVEPHFSQISATFNLPVVAHAVNNSRYPKTVNGFYVRVGFSIVESTGFANPTLDAIMTSTGRKRNQFANIRTVPSTGDGFVYNEMSLGVFVI